MLNESINLLFLISNIYWLLAFGYIVFRAIRHAINIINMARKGQQYNKKLNIKWLLYILFPFFKRYIFPDK